IVFFSMQSRLSVSPYQVRNFKIFDCSGRVKYPCPKSVYIGEKEKDENAALEGQIQERTIQNHQ
ncbi:MAG: hypothetical protein II127_08140, partial [Ruminococcus sp.]|nr:hypothetical protein [Ruminococcus sp.]